MKRYFISMDSGKDHNAATKARQDAERILLELGYEPVTFSVGRTAARNPLKQAGMFFEILRQWKNMQRRIERNSLILLQYPFFPMKGAYLLRWLLPGTAKKLGVRFVALIHDLNSLRGFYGSAARYSDRCFLKRFACVISHNPKMSDYLRKSGIPASKIIELGIFDYLTDAEPPAERNGSGINIAGNLDPEKSGYVSGLIHREHFACPIHLYGRGLGKEELPEFAAYHGSFDPDELPGRLEGKYGLVWDGSSTETCAGETGDYLRYNNPHKLSLYMAAGLPVLIWDQAALADFILKQKAGITIPSLDHIEEAISSVAEKEYAEMKRNAEAVGQRVRSGWYLTEAVKRAEAFSTLHEQ